MKTIYLVAVVTLFTMMANVDAKEFQEFQKNKNGEIRSFFIKNQPLDKIVNAYAKIAGKRISYVGRKRDKRDGVAYLRTSKPITMVQLEDYFLEMLGEQGFTMTEEAGGNFIIPTRDVRYSAMAVYKSDDYPKRNLYISVFHTMKYPVARRIIRNLRPFISRYGRLVEFGDQKTIVIMEKGKNIPALLKTIDRLDSEVAYKQMVKNMKDQSGKKSSKKKEDKNMKDLLERLGRIEEALMSKKDNSHKGQKKEHKRSKR